MQITTKTLTAANACRNQRDLFARLFPRGSPRTKRAALAAARRHAGAFDWVWAAMRLLTPAAWAAYLAAYRAATAPARAAYDAAIAAAFVDALFSAANRA